MCIYYPNILLLCFSEKGLYISQTKIPTKGVLILCSLSCFPGARWAWNLFAVVSLGNTVSIHNK